MPSPEEIIRINSGPSIIVLIVLIILLLLRKKWNRVGYSDKYLNKMLRAWLLSLIPIIVVSWVGFYLGYPSSPVMYMILWVLALTPFAGLYLLLFIIAFGTSKIDETTNEEQ